MRRVLFGLLAGLLVLVGVLPVGAWGGATRLTDTPINEFNTDVAAAGSRVHVVWNTEWAEVEWPYLTHRTVRYRRSVDGGALWQPAVTLSGSALLSQDPVVLVSGLSVDVLWISEREDDSFGLFRRHSANGGQTWGPIEAIPSGKGAYDFAAVVVGDVIHLVYVGVTATDDLAVFYRWRSDAVAWVAPTRLGPADLDTRVDVAPGVHAVWSSDPGAGPLVYYQRIGAGGRVALGRGLDPAVAANGTEVAVAWNEQLDADERLRVRLKDGTGLWGPRQALTPRRGEVHRPDIAFFGNGLHVVWAELPVGGVQRTYHRSTQDLGITWAARSGIPSAGATPTIKAAGLLHLVDEAAGPAGNAEVFYQTGP